MTSNDVFVVIGGQQFRIAGDTLLPMQNSFQQEVLKRFDGIESRLDKVESRLDKVESRLDKVETRLGNVEQSQLVLQETLAVQGAQIDMLIWWGGIAFTVLAAIIAFVGIFAPKLWDLSKRKTAPHNDERVNFTISLTDLLAKGFMNRPFSPLVHVPQYRALHCLPLH